MSAQTPAEVALASGDIERASNLATAALVDSPDDPVALAVMAAVRLAKGQPEAARKAAGRSWQTSSSAELRFVAATLAGRAALQNGAPMAAQIWLRRALQAAPDPGSRQATINEIKAIRARQRLHFSFDLSVSPSDNVNNGSAERVLSVDGRPTVFVFDGSALALSGVESSITFGMSYRLAGTSEEGSEIGLRLSQSAVALSPAAKRLAPGARTSDYSRTTVDLSFSRTLKLDQGRWLRAGAGLTQNWFGGALWSRQARVDAQAAFLVGEQMLARAGISASRQWRTANLSFATALTLDGGIERHLASGDVLGFRLTATRTMSADRNQENTRLAGELRFSREKPLAGAKVSASLGLASVDYPVFFGGIFGANGREDMTVSTALEMAFPEMGAYGFEPVIALRGSKTKSNVSRYETKALGLEVRIRSSF